MDYRNEFEKEGVIVRSPSMVQIYEKARLLARNQASVLICGESGVGKNHLAEYIQKKGASPNSPFIRIHCNALSDQLFASELFGYSPNAFTGASAKGKIGLLEAANQGTVLFDEINELSPENQTLLLHFLQNRTFTPIGSLKSREIHTRVICTAGRNLRKMIDEGTFRADLFYRICVANIHIPPIRKRREEIPFFIHFFIRRFEADYHRSLKGLTIPDEKIAQLCRLDWRGNIREIENLAQQICLSTNITETIDAYLHKNKSAENSSLVSEPRFDNSPSQTAAETAGKATGESGTLAQSKAASSIKPLKEAMREFERAYIMNAICQSETLQAAADQLGISFSTLCRKKAEYGIERSRQK